MLDRHHLAVADHHVRPPLEDRMDELGDVMAVVLVVGVRVDDDVGAELERRVEPGLEARGQPLVVRQAHHVVDALLARDLDRAVGRAVVDDQPFDLVEALDASRELAQGGGEGLLLVQAGDLDDELHAAAARQYRRGSGGSSVAANLARRMSAWRSRLLREGPALALLAGISVVALVLRYQHLDYGLPYVYNQDEGSHFTSRAVAMFGGDADPGYFQNPSAFTSLVHVALRFKYGGWWPFGSFDDVIQHFARDPSGIYVAARRVAALLGAAGAVAVYSVGRRLWDRRTGLVAAAVLAFAFLPVTYSRIALTDVGVLVPVALVLLFAVRIQETGSLRWCAAAGAAAGVAIGFKYTAGLVLLAPLAALVVGTGGRREVAVWRSAALGGLVVLGVALVAFFITTP